MALRWPDLSRDISADRRTIMWTGPLRGVQRTYQVSVQLSFRGSVVMPRVFILEPQLRPRVGTGFEDIPHLLFNDLAPEDSALCLYDPAAGQWDSTMLIADTTVPWASEWLHHYECWHLDGVWRGANAPGPISVGEIRRQAAASEPGNAEVALGK